MRKLIFIFSLLLLNGCKEKGSKTIPAENVVLSEPDAAAIAKEPDSENAEFAKSIEEAHNIEGWKSKKAVSFHIDLSFGGNERMSAKITSLTNSSKIRIDKQDGSLMVFDGENSYLCPASTNDKGARFDMFTWQYFFALPFKLTDPGTQWEQMPPQKMEGTIFRAGKLTFKNNTGDTPDDWYIVYQDPESNLMHAAAYIVTFGSNKEKAEENPHCIVYKDYAVVDGIPVATTWEFRHWDQKTGIGEKIGEAKITDINFFPAKDNLFEQPENSKIIEANK